MEADLRRSGSRRPLPQARHRPLRRGRLSAAPGACRLTVLAGLLTSRAFGLMRAHAEGNRHEPSPAEDCLTKLRNQSRAAGSGEVWLRPLATSGFVIGPARRRLSTAFSWPGDLPSLPKPTLRPTDQPRLFPSRVTRRMKRAGQLYSSGAEVLLIGYRRRQAIPDAEHLVRQEGSPIALVRDRLTTLWALPTAFHLRRALPIAHHRKPRERPPAARWPGASH